MKQTCELCTMDATYKKEDKGVIHFYCDHHKEDGATKIVTMVGEKTSLQKLLPLLSFFGVVVLLTLVTAYIQHNTTIGHIMMLGMAFFFLVFGSVKLLNLSAFVEAYTTYDIIAMRYRIYAYFYPFVELFLGVLYFFYLGGIYRDVATFLLMMVGAYGVWKALQKKEEIPCACLGMVFQVPMTKVTLLENLLMAAMALYMIIGYFIMGDMVM